VSKKGELTTTESIVAGVLTVLVLGNGVLSAIVGSWWPTIAAVAFVALAGWYASRPPKRHD